MSIEIREQQDKQKQERLKLCPRGFVPKQGYGNCRTCWHCGRQYEDHAVVTQ